MDQSKALHKLLEAADLVGMIEDLTNPSKVDSFTPASWSGMRITLRSVREQLLETHRSLSRDLVSRSRAADPESARPTENQMSRSEALRMAAGGKAASEPNVRSVNLATHRGSNGLNDQVETVVD